MTIEAYVREKGLTGLAFALNQARPDAVLVEEWALEQKADFEACGSRGACWKHGVGVDVSNWPDMAADAAKHGTSMYDIIECYASKGEVYFGSGQAEQGSEALQLRAHITHTFSMGTHMYVCVVWVKGCEGITVTKCAAGFSAHYDPSEFHMLPLEEKEGALPPPYEIDFKE